jgi:D-glycero-alpha-D-manno-heptose-7-phosphate kinase
LNENWVHQKALHQSISSSELDDLVAFALRNGAIGGKACGAGGGGCLIFLAAPGQGDRLRRALRQRMKEVIEFGFDSQGVFLSKG